MADPLPQTGGSYTRDGKGALQRVAETKPAVVDAKKKPASKPTKET